MTQYEEQFSGFDDAVKFAAEVWSHKTTILVFALAGFLAALAFSMLSPKRFEARIIVRSVIVSSMAGSSIEPTIDRKSNEQRLAAYSDAFHTFETYKAWSKQQPKLAELLNSEHLTGIRTMGGKNFIIADGNRTVVLRAQNRGADLGVIVKSGDPASISAAHNYSAFVNSKLTLASLARAETELSEVDKLPNLAGDTNEMRSLRRLRLKQFQNSLKAGDSLYSVSLPTVPEAKSVNQIVALIAGLIFGIIVGIGWICGAIFLRAVRNRAVA